MRIVLCLRGNMLGNIDIIREILTASTFEEAKSNIKTEFLRQLEGTHQQLVINDNNPTMLKEIEDLIEEFRDI